MAALTDAGFAELLAGFRESWFKFECQPVYAITAEAVPLRRFTEDGVLLPPGEFGWWQGWLDQVAAHARAGRSMQRVRVVDEPPTAYQRYLLAVSHWHTGAGERIACLPRSVAARLNLPADHDWSLFDDTKVAVTEFTPEHAVAGRDLITDPIAVRQYRAWRDLALRHASPAKAIAAA